ncbi:MAG: GTPase domain-containing protein [Gemmataceae bacterium]|nr:GTPase domain-containing protein [Gemmata sp.]MDW8197459.1 GTPase domain-containing protein [Gemmataceae bacterium]
MEPTEHRLTISQLAEDFRWLEDHCRRQPDLVALAGRLRLASALTRNVVGPFLEGQPARPLHIAVVGGAGTGKSTVVNFLAGAVVAEANPQAGYTRHPTAFLPPGPSFPWPSFLGFLGPLQRLSDDQPANTDRDVYQVKRIPAREGAEPHPLAGCVIWDCPDMTTWAAENYVNRLLEVAGLADVVVYVASDERYNDEVPTQFLHLLVSAGKAIVVVLTKMRAADAAALVGHFRQEVLGRLPVSPSGAIPPIPVMALPQLTPDERRDPAGVAAPHRAALVQAIRAVCPSEDAARTRTVVNAARYLSVAGEGLLDVARSDLAQLEAWKAAVAAGQRDFEERYRREFLSGERFGRLDIYAERLLELLEPAGAGRIVSQLLWLLRSPYRWLRDSLYALVVRPEVLGVPEKTVVEASFQSWLDFLQAEALRKAGTHPLWKQLATRFAAELAPQARERFTHNFRTFEVQQRQDVEAAGQALIARWEKNPALLYSLRGGKWGLDVAIIAAVTYYTWPPGWLLLLIPVGVALTHQLAEWFIRCLVEGTRQRLRAEREALLTATLTQPLADWLTQWPSTGGTSLEKLQQVLHRVPVAIRRLEQRVSERVTTAFPPPAASPCPVPSVPKTA